MKINLVGKCGIYCGACSIFRAERDNEKERKLIADAVNCAVDLVKCNGCGGLTTKCWCYGCKILACLESKHYDFCYQCNEFDDKNCELYNKLAETYIKVGENIRDNLLVIKKGKVEEWLNEQDQKYRCPNCNHPVSVWDENCVKCHHQLK